MTDIDKIINAATDEIYDTVMFVLDQTKTYGTGNHFINDNYNIFVETATGWDEDDTVREEMYYWIKLEQYENDECIEVEVDCQDTSTLSKEDLRLGIERIIKSNIEEITGGK